MRKKSGIISVLLAALLLSFIFSGCRSLESAQAPPRVFSSYLGVPGVTEEEINAIEAIKEQYPHFTYGMLYTTESFYNAEGEIAGFSALVCEWLSELFGIPFIPENYAFSDLHAGLENRSVDFSGQLTLDERVHTHYMTDPIVQRAVKYFRIAGSPPLNSIRETRLPRYALVENSMVSNTVIEVAMNGFEPYYISEHTEAYALLKSGQADAFVTIGNIETIFEEYDDIEVFDFLPFILSPASFATKNSDLEPFISVLQKALKNGGGDYLNELYKQGELEYKRHKLFMQLTEEERDYIKNNPVINMGALYSNYPVDFYNEHEKEWQGAIFDILEEVTLLTELSFNVATDTYIEWSSLLQKLESGEISLIPQLNYLPEREGRYIWTDTVFMREHQVLISRFDFPRTQLNDIFDLRVGLIKDYSHTAVFHKLFPGHPNVVEYNNFDETLNALQRNEIDVTMGSMISLLSLMNYEERIGFKANYIFDLTYDIKPGFNKNETVLVSIIDKALKQVDIEGITSYWMRINFDYETRLLRAQRPWIIGASVLLLFILVLMTVLFQLKRHEEKRLTSLVKKRTDELNAALEEAQSANNSKSAFLATMSHEIRTPMNSIMGFAELALSSKDITSEIKDYLGKITDSTRWLLNIINDILDISKIESGRMELENEPFDLGEVIARCQSVALPSIKEKGLDLRVYAEKLPDKKLLGDPVRIYQALLNLLSNAVKFTNEGTVKLSSFIKDASEDKATVCFEVQDSGIGMTPEQVEKIYEPFVQADSSTTRNYGGTGLGLAITKSIVELMGGKLNAQSAPDAGSTFSFEITLDTADASRIAENGEQDVLEKPLFEGLILICDDNIMNQQVMRGHLESVGLNVVSAENGKIGVDNVMERIKNNEKPFDLILMDMFMPVMDGIEAATEIFALNTGTPIVAVTANVMTSELERYKKFGMPDCLGKPFTSQELWNILLKYLKPVGSERLAINCEQFEDELANERRFQFVKNNQNKYDEFTEALENSDFPHARRIAHSLKGNAGFIGKTKLQKAAAEIEDLLAKGGTQLEEEILYTFKTELETALEELKPLLNHKPERKNIAPLSAEEIQELFGKLTPMLKNRDTGCIDLLDEVLAIPGAKDLAYLIENCEFKQAAEALNELKKQLE